MANYNSGILYNIGVKGGGANYNSATYYIIEVSNAGQGEEFLSLIANVFASDSGVGNDIIGLKEFDADIYLVVTYDNILNPLGVYMLRDSSFELLPAPRVNSDEIPGRHGEIDFAVEFKARNGQLHLATHDGLSPIEKEQLKRTIAKYLSPIAGTKKLVFLIDADKQYNVKVSGKIEPTEYTDWFEFNVPFKMSNPLIESTVEHTLTGSGAIENVGNFETGIIIEIAGPTTNPSVTIGANILNYIGTITAGQTLIIDTDAQTLKIGSANAVSNYNGVFPSIPPGETNVVAPANVTIKWRDKWI
jgi:phage-related protein